jgi:Collagen triple helix repeat (20 copies)
MPDQSEIIQKLSVPRYAPRLKPTPIPSAAWNDTPRFCLEVNDEWVSHILGVMSALDQPDTWVGDEDQIRAARQQVNEIMLAFMSACEDVTFMFEVDGCHLKWRESVDDDWTDLGNVCGADGSDGVDGMDGEKGDTGDQGEKGDTGDSGATGADGAVGATGATGAAGEDCDCESVTHIETPPNPEGQTDDQSSCNISGNLAAYLRQKEVIAITQARSGVSLGLAIEAVAASIAAAVFTGGAAWPLIVAASAVLINIVLTADSAELDAMIADDGFFDAMACSIYCALKPSRDLTVTNQAAIGAAIRATTYTSGSYTAPFFYDVFATFFESLPIEVIRSNVVVGVIAAFDCSGCDCPEPPDCDCTVDITWYGCTATSDVSDPNIIHVVSTSGHVAFSTGNSAVGCYMTGVDVTWSIWHIGDGSPSSGWDTRSNRVWNMDAGEPPPGTEYTFTFSDCPIP